MAREEKKRSGGIVGRRAVATVGERKLRLTAGLLCLGTIATLAGCAAPAPRSQSAVSSPPTVAEADPCDQAHKDFMAAALVYTAAPHPGTPATGPQATRPAGISGLRAQAQAADDALAELVGTFGTLAACRSDVLSATEVRAAHGALDVAGTGAKQLAAQLAQQQGGRAVPAAAPATVAAAILATERSYLATDAGEIYDRPDSRARPIAGLRKGQRLTSPALAAGSATKTGWLPIDLNDGSTGYVAADLLRPLGGPLPEGASGNASTTVVAIDLITEALPEKLAALQARLAASEAATNGGT